MGKYHTKLQATVAEYRRQGLCSVEIAEKMGRKPHSICIIAKNAGFPFTEEEKERSRLLACKKTAVTLKTRYEQDKKNREYQAEWLRVNRPNWEWISGRIFLDHQTVTVKNKECGHIAEFSSKTVRNRNTLMLCPVCKAQEKAKAAEEKERQKAEEVAQRVRERTERFWQQDFKQRTFSQCPVCGAVVLNGNKYCSKKCCNSLNCSISKDKRVRRIGSGHRDNITLKEVYERGNGICYLCEEECDYGDYEERNGVFIAGNRYPSIDHVVPLSKGGTHTWDNVKLAHRICNTLKSNEVACL